MEYRDLADGAWPISAAVVADGEYVDANLDCVHEFQPMLAVSVGYAKEHSSEMAAQVAEESDVPAEFVEFRWQDGG